MAGTVGAALDATEFATTDTTFVQCPSREPHEMTLISPQIIPRSLCHQRQKEHFHKCPRCVNRCALMEHLAAVGA